MIFESFNAKRMLNEKGFSKENLDSKQDDYRCCKTFGKKGNTKLVDQDQGIVSRSFEYLNF